MSLVRAIESTMHIGGPAPGLDSARRACGGQSSSAVATVFEVGIEELRAPTRGSARAAFARQLAMYLAHVG